MSFREFDIDIEPSKEEIVRKRHNGLVIFLLVLNLLIGCWLTYKAEKLYNALLTLAYSTYQIHDKVVKPAPVPKLEFIDSPIVAPTEELIDTTTIIYETIEENRGADEDSLKIMIEKILKYYERTNIKKNNNPTA